MCIICNCKDTSQAPHDFLIAFERAQKDMVAAAAAMLACSNDAATQNYRTQYDTVHKRMVRLIREWNKLEHSREHPTPAEKP